MQFLSARLYADWNGEKERNGVRDRSTPKMFEDKFRGLEKKESLLIQGPGSALIHFNFMTRIVPFFIFNKILIHQ